MSVNLSLFAGAGAQFFDDNGVPLAGGLIYTYAAGTTSPLATYTSSSGITALPNPIVLNAAGRVPTGEIWVTTGLSYKFVVYTSANVLVASYDNVNTNFVIDNLSNTTNPAYGDALVGFRQSNSSGNLPNAVGRTVHQKLQENISVYDFGAVGDGSTNDTTAIANAAATVGPNGVLLLSNGTFVITSNTTLNCNLLFNNAKLSVSSGATVTISGTILSGLQQIFTGFGVVSITKETPIIYPEWWGALSDSGATDSYSAIDAAITCSSTNKNTVYFSGDYGIGTTLSIPATASTNCSRLSTLRPSSASSLTNGVIMLAGNAIGPIILPTLVSFPGVALEVRCALADIYVAQFNTCGTAIKFNSGATGVTSKVLDTFVRFNAISTCTTAVNFNANYTTDVIQGCGVYGNFITATVNGVLFSGTTSFNDGLFFDVLSVDFSTSTPGVFLDNSTSQTIARFTAIVRSWFGGTAFSLATPTQFVQGNWVNCLIDITNARGFDQTNFTDNLINASKIKFKSGWASRAGAIAMVPLSTGLAGFNGGKMMYGSNSVMKFTLSADLLSQASVVAYFWHVAADGNYYPWKMIAVDGGAGAIVERIHDQSTIEAGRVAISIRNVSASTIANGTTIYFYLERAS
jgi:hypothetical protein